MIGEGFSPLPLQQTMVLATSNGKLGAIAETTKKEEDLCNLVSSLYKRHIKFFNVYGKHLYETSLLTYVFLRTIFKEDYFSIDRQTYSFFVVGALLHDIGKDTTYKGCHIFELVSSHRKLTQQEFEIVKMHTIKGYSLLPPRHRDTYIGDAILYHHEHWDGKGYPKNLSNGSIPLIARVLSITDAFNAMRDPERAYKRPMDEEEALDEILKNAGSQFDPALATSFVNNYPIIRQNYFKILSRLEEKISNPYTQTKYLLNELLGENPYR